MQFRSHLTIFLITEHGILVLIFSVCDLVELDLCVSYNGVKTHLRVQWLIIMCSDYLLPQSLENLQWYMSPQCVLSRRRMTNCYVLVKLLSLHPLKWKYFTYKVRKKATIRNQYNQVPHLTQDTVWESDKINNKRHIQESQVVNPFPAGDHKAARRKQDNMAKTNTKKEYHLGTVSKKILEGLN